MDSKQQSHPDLTEVRLLGAIALGMTNSCKPEDLAQAILDWPPAKEMLKRLAFYP